MLKKLVREFAMEIAPVYIAIPQVACLFETYSSGLFTHIIQKNKEHRKIQQTDGRSCIRYADSPLKRNHGKAS